MHISETTARKWHTESAKDGAPTKQKQVSEWFEAHPGGSVSECARELQISKTTARKWHTETSKNGAPTKEKQVSEWFEANPGGSVYKCAKELDISENTAEMAAGVQRSKTRGEKTVC